MTRDFQRFHQGDESKSDHVELEILARCYRQRSGLPATVFVDGRNMTPAEYLESLATNGKGPCPDVVVELLDFAPHHASVATIARLLLDRLRSTGQLPSLADLKPLSINVRDDVEGLAALARAFRAERPVPHEIRVSGATIETTAFLSGFDRDRRECPASIVSDSGVSNFPASMREVATSLLGRLRQAGQL